MYINFNQFQTKQKLKKKHTIYIPVWISYHQSKWHTPIYSWPKFRIRTFTFTLSTSGSQWCLTAELHICFLKNSSLSWSITHHILIAFNLYYYMTITNCRPQDTGRRGSKLNFTQVFTISYFFLHSVLLTTITWF